MANRNPEGATRRQFVQVAAASAALGSPAVPLAAGATGHTPSSRGLTADVLVCGGGCAGIAAALSAARNGADVLLVEKAPFAGGIITCVGLPYFDGIANIRDRRIVVRGIALELLSKSGVCQPDARTVEKHNPTIPNTFEFKRLLDRLILERRVTLRVAALAAAEKRSPHELRGTRLREGLARQNAGPFTEG